MSQRVDIRIGQRCRLDHQSAPRRGENQTLHAGFARGVQRELVEGTSLGHCCEQLPLTHQGCVQRRDPVARHPADQKLRDVAEGD